ncbi:uncharacterized protein ATNIH1004_006575 [Aspergillus tanneri]|uniref:Uncharacterized protein n=1 Tax=Aspergillus tanneri TaxID=1220188 RepID=A0A5M9MSM7_9EURO|nr:uncharacterized protein ATNIH1004_006575 [Aspergillus tanneri]KAA8647873.1 hypothetical protein ATNIH1004_006575 [Aspergillus tanneri]
MKVYNLALFMLAALATSTKVTSNGGESFVSKVRAVTQPDELKPESITAIMPDTLVEGGTNWSKCRSAGSSDEDCSKSGACSVGVCLGPGDSRRHHAREIRAYAPLVDGEDNKS